MGKISPSPVIDQSRLLLNLFKNEAGVELSHHADDILTYFNLLHDQYSIAASKSPRFSGNSFNILEEVIYQLGSDPDATMNNAGFREFIQLVLEDIAQMRILVVPRKTS